MAEQFSWLQSNPDKKEKSSKDSDSLGSRPKFVNAPIARSTEHISLKTDHESSVSLSDHPRVLPDTLFKDLLRGKDLEGTDAESKVKKAEFAPPVPIPIEQAPPPPAQAEYPVYDPGHAEHVARILKEEAEADDEEDDEDEKDEAGEEKAQERQDAPDSEPVIVPLDTATEGRIPTTIDEALLASAASSAPEASNSDGSFMPLESEPVLTPRAMETNAEPSFATAAAPAPAAGGGTRPPTPPRPPVSGGFSPGFGRGESQPRPSMPETIDVAGLPRSESLAAPRANFATEWMRRTEIGTAKKESFRKGIVLGAVITYVLSRYLAKGRQQQFEADAERRMQIANQQIDQLKGDNARLQGRVNLAPSVPAAARYEQPQSAVFNQAPNVPTTHFEQPLYPQQPLQEQMPPALAYGPPRAEQLVAAAAAPSYAPRYEQPLQQRFEQPMTGAAAPLPRTELRPLEQAQQIRQPQAAEEMPKVIGEEGQEIVLQPGQRLERRGSFVTVVDEHGREVQGVVQYGKEYYSEQRQEHVPAALANTDTAAKGATAQDDLQGALGGGAYVGGGYTPAHGMLDSGQVDPSHELQSGQVDMDHRLSKRQNPIIATLANPVLWLAFALLVIAYFIAALI